MVCHAADNNRLAIMLGKDAAEVMVQFIAECFVAEEGATIFGRENGVNQNLC